jgi:predicted metal-dependent peptidase
MIKIQDQVARTTKSLIFTEPFYGLFLIGINKQYSEHISTAGVSKKGIGMQLTINPEFFNNLSEDHRFGLIKHELLHIAFGHLLLRDLYSDHKLFNIAADLEINQYILESNLPTGGLLL